MSTDTPKDDETLPEGEDLEAVSQESLEHGDLCYFRTENSIYGFEAIDLGMDGMIILKCISAPEKTSGQVGKYFRILRMSQENSPRIKKGEPFFLISVRFTPTDNEDLFTSSNIQQIIRRRPESKTDEGEVASMAEARKKQHAKAYKALHGAGVDDFAQIRDEVSKQNNRLLELILKRLGEAMGDTESVIKIPNRDIVGFWNNPDFKSIDERMRAAPLLITEEEEKSMVIYPYHKTNLECADMHDYMTYLQTPSGRVIHIFFNIDEEGNISSYLAYYVFHTEVPIKKK